MHTYQFQNFNKSEHSKEPLLRNQDLLKNLPLNILFSVGEAQLTLEDANYFQKGTMLPLDTDTNIPVSVQVQGKKVATGRVVVSQEGVFIEIT